MQNPTLRQTVAALAMVYVLTICAPSYADPIYRWVDKQGGVHYTNKPPSANATPAKLPEITREKPKPASTGPAKRTCSGHGDVDCEAGPDADGSVICRDGFRDASPRFNFTCKEVKLEITDVSDINKDGALTVFVRNLKGVASTRTRLRMLTESGEEVQLKGPAEIEPFGVAEFTYDVPPNPPLTHKPGKSQLTLECANCP